MIKEEKDSNIYLEQDFDVIPNFNIGSFNSFILRNKILIGKFTLISSLLGSLLIFTAKPVWRGYFQIVIKEDTSSSLGSLKQISKDIDFSNFSTLQELGNSKDIKTEIEVLKSPSILFPIYEFVRQYKINLKEWRKNYSFNQWFKKYIRVEREQRTSVLNISYKERDKDLIISVLNKIANEYKIYSKKFYNRDLNQGVAYLKNQVKIYSSKSLISQRKAQNYAIENDLFENWGNLNFSNEDADIKNKSFLLTNSVENIRVDAVNKIKKIESQLQLLNSTQVDDKILIQIASNIAVTSEQNNLINSIAALEKDLSLNRALFKDSSQKINSLKNQKSVLLDLLKTQTINYLEASKLASQATQEKFNRPKSVLLKYNEYLRKAARDEITLTKLEDNLRLLSLELERKVNPWEIITKPTLSKKPVFPQKKNVLSVFIILGFILGSLYATYKEKKSGLIFNKEELKNILGDSFLDGFQKIDNKNIEEISQLISLKIKKNSEFKSLGLFSLEEKQIKYLETLKSRLLETLPKLNIKVSNNPFEISDYEFRILFITMGRLKRNDAFRIKNVLDLEVNREDSFIIFM